MVLFLFLTESILKDISFRCFHFPAQETVLVCSSQRIFISQGGLLRCGGAANPVWREPPVRTNGAIPLICYLTCAGSSP